MIIFRFNFYQHEHYIYMRYNIFNIGGGIHSNVSILEAIEICQEITGNKINFSYINKARKGDHIYWVTDMKKFKKFYPKWNIEYNTKKIIKKMYEYEKII